MRESHPIAPLNPDLLAVKYFPHLPLSIARQMVIELIKEHAAAEDLQPQIKTPEDHQSLSLRSDPRLQTPLTPRLP